MNLLFFAVRAFPGSVVGAHVNEWYDSVGSWCELGEYKV